jgi:ribosomal protein S18 acetylase RimI-like enzyme
MTSPGLDQSNSRAFGLFELRQLQWDTAFFGRKMGTLALRGDGPADRPSREMAIDLRLALREAKSDGYAHVILRASADRFDIVRAAEQAGMHLVDVAVDFALRLDGSQGPDTYPSATRQAQDPDVDELCRIAAGAFTHSRFRADPFFSAAEVGAFYRQWIRNLYDGHLADVLVAESEGAVAGFVSCALDGQAVRIPLIATSDQHRGKGIGRALTLSAVRWATARQAAIIKVKTQAANFPAVKLYERCGFTTATAELTLSAILPSPSQP